MTPTHDHYEVAWHLCDYDEDAPVGACDSCDCALYEDDAHALGDRRVCSECAKETTP